MAFDRYRTSQSVHHPVDLHAILVSIVPVRIVLVEPSHPGNIGAVARAMGNMGFSELSLVRPVEFLVEEARVRSASNEEILANAAVCSSLSEAIGDCTCVVGTSARIRTIGWPNLPPQEAMNQVAERSVQGAKVALLFGPERAGLLNRQIDQCDMLVRIPVNEEAPSINLAGAVLIMLYELRLALDSRSEVDSGTSVTLSPNREENMANQAQVQGLFEHMQRVLSDVDFIATGSRKSLMRKIRRIFLMPGLTEDEVNILRGILTAVTNKIGGSKRSSE